MRFLIHEIRLFFIALQFFTRVPVPAWVGYHPDWLQACQRYFPLVGALVGTAGALALATTAAFWPPLVAVLLSMAFTVWLTGGFHEDGWADTCDALGGTVSRERALEIMKDSRIGAFGAMALVLALLAKVSLLALLGAHSLGAVLAALAGGHVLSRLWPLFIVRWLPHVGDTARSKSKPLADQISRSALAAAALWCFVPLALVYQAQAATFLIASITLSMAAAAWMGRWFARRLQGFTGDCLGATQQVGDIGFYLGAALALGAAR
mgnify:CR=1 FL=1